MAPSRCAWRRATLWACFAHVFVSSGELPYEQLDTHAHFSARDGRRREPACARARCAGGARLREDGWSFVPFDAAVAEAVGALAAECYPRETRARRVRRAALCAATRRGRCAKPRRAAVARAPAPARRAAAHATDPSRWAVFERQGLRPAGTTTGRVRRRAVRERARAGGAQRARVAAAARGRPSADARRQHDDAARRPVAPRGAGGRGGRVGDGGGSPEAEARAGRQAAGSTRSARRRGAAAAQRLRARHRRARRRAPREPRRRLQLESNGGDGTRGRNDALGQVAHRKAGALCHRAARPWDAGVGPPIPPHMLMSLRPAAATF